MNYIGVVILIIEYRLADGEWVDRHANAANLDPISKMEALLLQQRDRAAIAQWGVWLAHRDPERGFKVS